MKSKHVGGVCCQVIPCSLLDEVAGGKGNTYDKLSFEYITAMNQLNYLKATLSQLLKLSPHTPIIKTL